MLAATTWLAVPGQARPARAATPRSLFLPLVQRPPAPEPCGPAARDPCAPLADQAWELSCGGFGRVRDLVVPLPLTPGGPAVALAVGDGAARLTLERDPSYEDAPVLARWEPRIGVDLTGLNALSYELAALPGRPQGWAAGERDRILTLRAGCWRLEDSHHERAVTLKSIHTAGGGWAVGSRTLPAGEDGPSVIGVLRGLVRPTDGPAYWAQFPLWPPPPALVDVYYTPGGHGGSAEAWALGAAAGEGLFFHGLQAPDGSWSWREAVRRSGQPTELTLRSLGAEGWAFGAGWQAGQAGLASWRYERGGRLWEPDEGFFLPGRSLVDVYSASDLGSERLWVGLAPEADQPVLARLDLAAGRVWELLARPPAEMPAGSIEGQRAIGPLARDAVLYAWGDTVWLFRAAPAGSPPPTPPAGGDPAGESWTLLRRARDLRAFSADAEGGLALADEGSGSAILSFAGMSLQVQAQSPGRLEAMAASGPDRWLVGRDGLTLVLSGGRLRRLDSGAAAGADLLALAVPTASTRWAAGQGRDGHGRLWRHTDEGQGWVEWARTSRPGALRALAALADGQVWAVGDACLALHLSPGAGIQEQSPCAGNTEAVDLAAVAATAPEAAWAGGSYFVYRWDGRRWQVMRAPGGGTALDFLATGDHLTHLAALPPDDVWGLARAAGDSGREASTTLQLSGGRWRRGTLFNVPLTDLRLSSGPDGRRTVWLAGHGSTLARRDYVLGRP